MVDAFNQNKDLVMGYRWVQVIGRGVINCLVFELLILERT